MSGKTHKGGMMLSLRTRGTLLHHYPCCPGHDQDGTTRTRRLWRKRVRRAEERAWIRAWRSGNE